jgi:hypothetical protein
MEKPYGGEDRGRGKGGTHRREGPLVSVGVPRSASVPSPPSSRHTFFFEIILETPFPDELTGDFALLFLVGLPSRVRWAEKKTASRGKLVGRENKDGRVDFSAPTISRAPVTMEEVLSTGDPSPLAPVTWNRRRPSSPPRLLFPPTTQTTASRWTSRGRDLIAKP